MSFTCPSCLWTSHSPRDESECYCGNCHSFQRSNFSPSELEKSIIVSILAPPELAADRVRRQLAQFYYRETFTPAEIFQAITRLSTAREIPAHQRALLNYAASVAEGMSRSTPSDWVMTAE